jgi:membrane protein DedA with SNARE-associated domain
MNLTDLFLNGMMTYGPLILGLALLLGSAGLPIPTGLLVLAAGAFARQGILDWTTAALVALVGVVLGDLVSYGLGRLGGGWLQQVLVRRRSLWNQALARFRRYGALAIYSTRVVLTSLDVPTNLVAGSSRFALGRFVAYDVAGRLTWLALYGGLGYIAGQQWPAVSQALGQYGLWLGIAAALAAGLYVLFHRLWQRRQSSPGINLI